MTQKGEKVKTIFIKEWDEPTGDDGTSVMIGERLPKDCLGCWNCWWATPGKCVHKDLDDFYPAYLEADRAVFFGKVMDGFVSGPMKSLFDRMICLFLPYTVLSKTRRNRHMPRYDRYPKIEYYYDGEFESPEAKQTFLDYIEYVFREFYSDEVSVKPINEFRKGADA
jgi:hypothetical protein